eukprot:1736961-Pleurochrysis_carterae.AAC.1
MPGNHAHQRSRSGKSRGVKGNLQIDPLSPNCKTAAGLGLASAASQVVKTSTVLRVRHRQKPRTAAGRAARATRGASAGLRVANRSERAKGAVCGQIAPLRSAELQQAPARASLRGHRHGLSRRRRQDEMEEQKRAIDQECYVKNSSKITSTASRVMSSSSKIRDVRNNKEGTIK